MPLGALGALVGLGGAAQGIYSDRAAKKQRRAREAAGGSVLNFNRGIIGTGFQQSSEPLYEALGLIGANFDAARNELSQVGFESQRGIYEAGERSFEEGVSRLQARGLGSTNIVEQLRSGVNAQTARQVGQVGESIGSQQAGLLQRQALAESDVLSRLSQLYQGRTAALVNNELSRFGLVSGITLPEYQGSSVDLGGIAALIASFSDLGGE